MLDLSPPAPRLAQRLSRWGCRCRRVSRSPSRRSHAARPFEAEGAGLGVTPRPVGAQVRVLLGLPRWRSPAGAEGRSPGDCPSGQPGLPPRRDRLSGRGGSAGQYPGGRWSRPAALARTATARTPKKTSREGKGRMLHLCSGKRGDWEQEFLAVEVQRGTAFVGHGSAGGEVHQRC